MVTIKDWNDTEHTVKPGMYLSTSWGYDQTNIDFAVVVEVSPSGKTVVCKRARPVHVGEAGQSDCLIPGEAAGAPFRLQVRGNGIRGSYPFIIGHDSKRFGYFRPVALGDVHYQTMTNFGH